MCTRLFLTFTSQCSPPTHPTRTPIGLLNSAHIQYFPSHGDVLVLADAVEEFRAICMKPPKHEVDHNTPFYYKS